MINKITRKLFRITGIKRGGNRIKVNAIFVVSTGRTGTLFLETLFNEIIPNSFSVHEPEPDLFDLGMAKLRSGKSSEEIVQYIVSKRLELLKSFHPNEKVETYIECNPFMSIILDEVKMAFPKSKFIILTRDAKTYVKSALNKSPNDDDKMFMYGDDDHRNRMSALDYKNDKSYSKWNRFGRIEKILWYWNKCNLILLNFLDRHKKNAIHVSFERLFNVDDKTKTSELNKILNFINVEPSEAKLARIMSLFENKKNNTNAVFFDGYEEWSEKDKRNFEYLTKEATTGINKL